MVEENNKRLVRQRSADSERGSRGRQVKVRVASTVRACVYEGGERGRRRAKGNCSKTKQRRQANYIGMLRSRASLSLSPF